MGNLITKLPFNRRGFLAGATATAALSLSGTSFASTPKKGGSFRLGLFGGSTSDSFDPATYASTGYVVGCLAVFNNLVEIDADGNTIPELAESWNASADAKVWTFNIRKGVEFHNGKALDANDVKASFNHHMGEDSKSGAKSLLASVTDLSANDSHTVTFTLDSGNADFPVVMADYHFVICQAKGETIDWESKIGTGGYTVVSFDPGVSMKLKRAPNYWKPDRAHFDEVEIITINDPTAKESALISGIVDVIDAPNMKTLDMLGRTPGIKIVEITGTQHYTLPMFADVAPFDNNDTRLALKYAIDREELVKKILLGHGRVGNDSPITPGNRYFNYELEQRVYDPDKARFYLKKAGHSSLKVDLSASDAAFTGGIDLAVLYKEQASAAGIDINIIREPADGYWSEVWMKKPFVECIWGGRPTEDWMFSLVYASDASWNDTHWKHERFDRILIEARAELDENKRRLMYYDLQEIVRNEGSTIIPLYANDILVRSERVAHGKVAANLMLDGVKIIERWWAA